MQLTVCRRGIGCGFRPFGLRGPASDELAVLAPDAVETRSDSRMSWLLVLNKPAGVAAHGGSGISRGVIEQLRLERPELRFLELVHRLDRDTSGVLLLAKKRSALIALHEQIRAGSIGKWYAVLVSGKWRNARPASEAVADEVRHRIRRATRERGPGGRTLRPCFTLVRALPELLLARGRTQDGSHPPDPRASQHIGFPIAGDDKYGDFALNKTLPHRGLKRMFLHAHGSSSITRARDSRSPSKRTWPQELQTFIDRLASRLATSIPQWPDGHALRSAGIRLGRNDRGLGAAHRRLDTSRMPGSGTACTQSGRCPAYNRARHARRVDLPLTRIGAERVSSTCRALRSPLPGRRSRSENCSRGSREGIEQLHGAGFFSEWRPARVVAVWIAR